MPSPNPAQQRLTSWQWLLLAFVFLGSTLFNYEQGGGTLVYVLGSCGAFLLLDYFAVSDKKNMVLVRVFRLDFQKPARASSIKVKMQYLTIPFCCGVPLLDYIRAHGYPETSSALMFLSIAAGAYYVLLSRR